MSFVEIQYTDLYDLINKFENSNFSNQIKTPQCNFVIVNKSSYQGCYGGIFHKDQMKSFKQPFIYDFINPNYIIVWWQIPCTEVGDLSLTKNEGAVVTHSMYYQMKKASIYKPIKSSYHHF